MNNNRFKHDTFVSDTLMTTSGNGTERSISQLNQTLNPSQKNALTDFANS